MNSAIRYEDPQSNRYYLENIGTLRTRLDDVKIANELMVNGWKNVVIVDEDNNIIYSTKPK